MALSEAEELELLELEEQEAAQKSPSPSTNAGGSPMVAPPTSTNDALMSGVGQAIGGFGDEIVGGIGAGVQKLSGNDRPFVDLYREHRDAQRMKDKQAAAEHPVAYGAGKYLPQMGLAAVTGGYGNVALAGLQGLGESSADVTKGEIGDAALDAGKSAAIQGAFGLAGKGIAAGTKAFANSEWPTTVSNAAGELKGLVGGAVAEVPHVVENARKSISWIMEHAPESLGKFGGMLRKAAERGGAALATTDFLLKQRSPEYQQLMKEKAGQ